MQKIERLFRKDLILRTLSLGLGFALAEFILKVTVHFALGRYGAFDYPMGAVVGFFSNFLIGAILAIPLGLRPSLAFLSYGFIGLFLLYDAFAYLIHAETGHIPALEALFVQLASAGADFYLKGLAAGGVATLLAFGVAGLFEKRLDSRYENVRVRIADAVTVFIFGVLGFFTLIGGVGPVYYGTVPPLLHLASGREPTDPEPSENLPHHHHQHHHDHEHHRHEHGFVPEEEREPFPADGLPRPMASMRMQYQGLLGVEAPRPIRDTAYPFCRDEAAAGKARAAHDLLVIDFAGLDREALEGELDVLFGTEKPRVVFDSIYSVSIDAQAGRRALLSGVPPLAPRQFAQPARGFPGAIPMPRLPSLAEELRTQAEMQTAYFGPAKEFRGETLAELKLLRFDRLVLESESEDAAKNDLQNLRRLEMYYLDRSRGPKFAFLELESTRDGALSPEVRDALKTLLEKRPEASVILTSSAPKLGDSKPVTRLNIPFAVRSDRLGSERASDLQEALSERLGSSIDLPQTVLGLVGAPRRGCFQGRDLLSVEEPFPSRRVVLSELEPGAPTFSLREVRGHGEQHFVWIIDGTNPLAKETPAELYDPKLDPAMRSDLFSRRDPDWPQLDEFWKSHLAIGVYLLRTDRFRPPPPSGDVVKREPPKESVQVTLIEGAIPTRPGEFLYEVRERNPDAHQRALSARHRSAGLTLELNSALFRMGAPFDAQLREILGDAYREKDAILTDQLGLAIAFSSATGGARPIGYRLPFGAETRIGYYKKLRELGVDFVYTQLPSDTLIEAARSAGLEIWTTAGGARLLDARVPDRIVNSN